MKALVIAGGGAKGAWGGGIVQYLLEQGAKYGILVGTSTGSMLITLIGANNIAKLKTAYTTIKQSDIFTHNPFKANAPDMELNPEEIAVNIVIRGEKTFGDSSVIAQTIRSFFNQTDFNAAKQCHVVACVSNLTKEAVEYYDIKDCEYEDFCDWVQASGSYVPFMSVVNKNGNQYMDGGIFEPLPIQKAIDMGATDIDVIVFDPKGNKATPADSKNVFQLIARLTDCMSRELLTNDEMIGQLEAKDNDVKLNVYYTPTVLTNNSLLFDEATMLQWWEQGYEFAKGQGQEVVMVKAKLNNIV